MSDIIDSECSRQEGKRGGQYDPKAAPPFGGDDAGYHISVWVRA